MNKKAIGIIAGIISFLAIELGSIQWILRPRPPDWFPIIDTMGTMNALFVITGNILIELIPLVPALGFGYYLGYRMDVAREWSSFVKAVIFGSTFGVLLKWVMILVTTIPQLELGPALLHIGRFTQLWVNYGLIVIIGILAGTTLAYFPIDDQSPGHSTEAPEETQSVADAGSETTDFDTQSTQ